MIIKVVNDKGESIRASLFFYDENGQGLGESVIPVGGIEVDRIEGATRFRFVADGFKDAVITDLYEYDNTTIEMIPTFRWLLPAVAGGLAVYLISKYVKI
jgi:hypothetical protein